MIKVQLKNDRRSHRFLKVTVAATLLSALIDGGAFYIHSSDDRLTGNAIGIGINTGAAGAAFAAKSTDPTVLQHGQFVSTGNQLQQFSATIPITDKEQGKAITLTFMNGPDNLPAFNWVRVFMNDQTNRSALSKTANGQPTGRMIVNETSFKGSNKVDLNATGVMKPGSTYTIVINGAGLKGAALGWKLTTPPAGVMTVSSVSPVSARGGGTLTINGSGFATNASDNTVYIDKTKATVSQAFPTSLQITVPPSLVPGKYSLTVTSKNTTSNPVQIKVLGMPELLRSDWLAGPCGATVTIFGKNFSDEASENNVFFGGTKAKVTAATPESLTVIVPDIPELQGATSYVTPTQIDITLTVGTTPVKGHLPFTSARVGWQQ